LQNEKKIFINITLFMILFPGQHMKSQVDSTYNYYFITQQMDAYYDSIYTIGGDSALKGIGYKEYIRWKNHAYFSTGKQGNMNAHEEFISNYYDGTRQIPESEISDWKYFGPKGIPETYEGVFNYPSINGKGMMLSVYVYPDNHNIILVGSHNSGLWKTEDGGEKWFCLTDDNYKIRGVNSIIVNPQDNDEILISSFNSLSDYSYGLFKSSDGGQNWTEMNNGLEFVSGGAFYPGARKRTLPRKLILRESDGAIFYITHSYVFKANSFDDDWERLYYDSSYPNWLYGVGFFDIEFDTQNDSIIYLSGTNILKSMDDGENWINLDTLILGNTSNHTYIRTEISTHKNFAGKAWFATLYTTTAGQKLKIVEYDEFSNSNHYTVLLDTNEKVGMSVYAMEFEVSPLCEDIFLLGGVSTKGYDDASDSLFDISSHTTKPSNPNWLHVDIREMKVVYYDSLNYRVYVAHDGGISWADLDGNTGECWDWNFKPGSEEHGLDVYEFYDFTCLDSTEDLVFGGTQDMSGFSFRQGSWRHFGGGDGGETVIDNSDPNETYVYYNIPGANNGIMLRSTNFGETWEKMMEYHQAGDLFTGLALEPFDPKILYYASDKLYKWNNARIDNQPDTIHAVDNNDPLSDVEIQHNGGNGYVTYRLVSSQKAYLWEQNPTPPANFSKCFWFGNDDKSANMLGLRYGFITDIETNPKEHGEIWTAYGKATTGEGDTTKKIYRSETWGSVDSWTPFAEGFPEGIPVRKLLYDHKYNRLYCASDIGVWVRDLNLLNHEWVEFNNNLPFKIVTDLEILYSQGVIRAATYGRGIWESPIYCNYDEDSPYIVDSTELWEDDIIMTSDIIIPHGTKLIIRNCNIFMPSNARIVVQRNAQLSLDNAHISNACNHLWKGIEVWGDPNSLHDTTYQGHVKSSNGTLIENAHCAMYTRKTDTNGHNIHGYYGGILQITNTTFRNNRRAIELWPYNDSTKTFFRNCTFETTKKLLDNYNFEYFIAMAQYFSAKIEGCSFRNTMNGNELPAHYRGTGIHSIESKYTLDKFDTTGNAFEGLNYGIRAYSISSNRSPSVKHTNFNANVTGAYFSGISGLIMHESDFGVQPYDSAYNDYIYCGLYLDNCTGYWVEGNNFNNPTPDNLPRPEKVIGVTVNNSGGEPNEIYRNTFDGMDIGILAQNSNRNASNTDGLVIKCNDFGPSSKNFEYDIAVTAYQGWPNAGIKRDQGDDFDPTAPAGNMFSHLPDATFSDYYNEASGIFYYQHKADAPWQRLDLEDYTSLTISKEETDLDYIIGISCQSNVSKTEGELKSAITENEEKTDSVDFLLDALVDGGDTQELESEVALSTPPEAYTVYDDLMMKSPYLTDTVMIKAINKEDVLNQVMVKDVLVANPQSAKSDKVMEELDNRMNPLPEYMVTEIEAGKDILGDKELMEASKSYFKHQRAINLNLLKQFYIFDTLETANSDSLVALLQNENTIAAKYELTFEYVRRGEYSLANAELSSIPNQFVLSDERYNTHQQYVNIMPVITDIHQNNKSVFDLDSLQIALLDSIAIDSNCKPGIYARNMLVYAGVMEYTEPYLLPDSSLKAISSVDKLVGKRSMPPRFKVYPNPASGYIAIEYNIQQQGCDGHILLRDNLGKIVKTIPVSSNKHSFIIPTTGLSNGVYYLSLQCNNNHIATEKIAIQH
jgi:hypothetical protein